MLSINWMPSFDDFRIFVKITEKLRSAQELLRKDAEDLTGKTCKIGDKIE